MCSSSVCLSLHSLVALSTGLTLAVAHPLAFPQYLSFPASERGQPPALLRGFDKVRDLRPGETRTAHFVLRNKDVAVWDVVHQAWTVPDGTLTVRVGSDSRSFVGEPLELPSLK